jgi:hypothetical protein
VDVRDIAAGAVCIAMGGYFAADSLINLHIGSAGSMGPGYFPAALGTILVILGIVMLLKAVLTQPIPLARPSWRAVALLSSAPPVWGMLLVPLGFIPATILACFIAVWSSREMTPVFAVSLSFGLTILSALVFVQGLGLPIPLLGSWLRG